MVNIVLFGKPGAGKGTQAELLKKRYQLTHISTGDLFRKNIKNKTALGVEAKEYIDKGELVPDELTIRILEDQVNKHLDSNGFLFDGFPRTIPQATALEAFLTTKSWSITATIGLEADDEILIKRLIERGKTSGRADDQDESNIRNRYEQYNKKTAPLIDFYKKKELYYGINGIGTIDEVTQRMTEVIEEVV